VACMCLVYFRVFVVSASRGHTCRRFPLEHASAIAPRIPERVLRPSLLLYAEFYRGAQEAHGKHAAARPTGSTLVSGAYFRA
jgi:hypothetical protein